MSILNTLSKNKVQVYQFNKAIVRKPAQSVINGLRFEDKGIPEYSKIKQEHDAYIAALEGAGVDVIVLEPLEEFPDSIFVEDPALVFSEGAIILRPGVDSRLKESEKITPVLKQYFSQILQLPKEGYVDGGDILNTPDGVMIGLSARTDLAGAKALIQELTKFGYNSEIVSTPEGVLHFKTDCSLLDEETVLTTARLANSGVFNKFKQIIIPQGEEAAANALRVNDVVFIGEGFDKTIELVSKHGYTVKTLKTSEIGKIDAGLSCMSLRWFQHN